MIYKVEITRLVEQKAVVYIKTDRTNKLPKQDLIKLAEKYHRFQTKSETAHRTKIHLEPVRRTENPPDKLTFDNIE